MASGLFDSLAESLIQCSELCLDCALKGGNCLSKKIGFKINNYKFEKYFELMNLRNSYNEYPVFKKWDCKKFVSEYYFKTPEGLGVEDFSKNLKVLSSYMSVHEKSLSFSQEGSLVKLTMKNGDKSSYEFDKFFKVAKLGKHKSNKVTLELWKHEDNHTEYYFKSSKDIALNDLNKSINAIGDFMRVNPSQISFEVLKQNSFKLIVAD